MNSKPKNSTDANILLKICKQQRRLSMCSYVCTQVCTWSNPGKTKAKPLIQFTSEERRGIGARHKKDLSTFILSLSPVFEIVGENLSQTVCITLKI